MRVPTRPLLAIFALISLAISILSFIGGGHLVGFLNETERYTTGFFVLDAFNYLNPIKRYLHLAILPAFLGLLFISIEGIPFVGKILPFEQFTQSTALKQMTAFFTMVFLGIQTIPAVFIEDHIVYSNPTHLSDYIMNDGNGYILFTVIYVLSIGTGMVAGVTIWISQKNPTDVQTRNFIITTIIIVLLYISLYGIFKWDGFYAAYGVIGMKDFLLVYSRTTAFQGFILLLRGPISDVTHLIVLPGFIGLTLMTVKKFKATWEKFKKGGKDTYFDSIKVSKLSLLSLVIIFFQIVPIAIFGYNEKFFFLKSATWASDGIMNVIGYPAFTVSYFIGLIRAMTGYIGFAKKKKNKK